MYTIGAVSPCPCCPWAASSPGAVAERASLAAAAGAPGREEATAVAGARLQRPALLYTDTSIGRTLFPAGCRPGASRLFSDGGLRAVFNQGP